MVTGETMVEDLVLEVFVFVLNVERKFRTNEV
jgi:hypothetical protein